MYVTNNYMVFERNLTNWGEMYHGKDSGLQRNYPYFANF
jgi:hypothetical protein